MILITGATGRYGSSVLQHLGDKVPAGDVAVLARDERKAVALRAAGYDVRMADFDDVDSLPEAFAGIERMLFVSTMSLTRGEQQRSVVDAAVAAGIGHIVYTGLSIRDIDTSHTANVMRSHFETERHIVDSGVTYTFMRNTMYGEALPDIAMPTYAENTITLAGGTGRAAYALRPELAEAAANVMLHDGHANRVYELTGAAAWSYADVAEELTRQGLLGGEVGYRATGPDEFAALLERTPLPPFVQQLTLNTVRDVADGQYDNATDDLASLLGRDPAHLSEIVRVAFERVRD